MNRKTILTALLIVWGTTAPAADFETAASAVDNMRIGWNLGNTDGGYDNYRSNLLAFARYFVEQAKANNMAIFYWMGLSDGAHRSVPEFSQADLKDAIVEGYYGEDGPSLISPPRISEPSAVADCYDLSGRHIPALRQQRVLRKRSTRRNRSWLTGFVL